MKTIRRIALFTVPLIALFLSGCGKNKDGSVPAKQDKIHIRVWETDGGIDEFIKQAGKEFSKLRPDVAVDYIYVGLPAMVEKLEIDAPAGVAPDIITSPHDTLGIIVSKNLVLPTRNPGDISRKVLGACSKALTYNGTMYGYPVSAETYALFYNKKLIKEQDVPKTWDDLVGWSGEFIANNPRRYPFVMDFMNMYYSVIFTTMNGNRLYGESGSEGQNPHMGTKDAIRGMEFFQSLREKLGIGSTELNTATCDGLFSSGNAAMCVTGLWNVKPFEKAGIDFGVAALPSLPGENKPAASFSGTRGMFVTAASKHPDVAADFLEFLLTPEMQQLRFSMTGAMPSIDTAVSSKYMAGFTKQLGYAFPMPSIPAMGNMWSESSETLRNIWNGADVAEEMRLLNEKIKG